MSKDKQHIVEKHIVEKRKSYWEEDADNEDQGSEGCSSSYLNTPEPESYYDYPAKIEEAVAKRARIDPDVEAVTQEVALVAVSLPEE